MLYPLRTMVSLHSHGIRFCCNMELRWCYSVTVTCWIAIAVLYAECKCITVKDVQQFIASCIIINGNSSPWRQCRRKEFLSLCRPCMTQLKYHVEVCCGKHTWLHFWWDGYVTYSRCSYMQWLIAVIEYEHGDKCYIKCCNMNTTKIKHWITI